MENLKYPELFKPFDIGSCHVKNRVVMTAMDTKHETENYIWSDETIGYYIERAKGGTLARYLREDLAPRAPLADAVGRERYERFSRLFVGAIFSTA